MCISEIEIGTNTPIFICKFFFNVATAQSRPPYCRDHDHNQTHHSRQDSSDQMINLSHRPFPNTKHSQDADIYAPGSIQTLNSSKQTAKRTALDRAAIEICIFKQAIKLLGSQNQITMRNMMEHKKQAAIQCMYNATLRCVHITIVAPGKHEYCIF